jgi:glycosyltransferase involved in cell wall biosynthesis
MQILGGQAVQADRLIRAWAADTDVEAWLVPVNPVPAGLLRYGLRVKYMRTVFTQLAYWPLLVRELRRADIVHVFSASYWSFLLAPLPAYLVARLFGKPVVMNYRSGEAPDHLRRSAIARAVLRRVDRNVVPSRFLKEVFRPYQIHAEVIPNIVDVDRFSFRVREPLRPRILSTRNFETLYNVECTLRTFAAVKREFPPATLTLVGGGSSEKSLRALAEDLGLREGVDITFAGRVAPGDIWRYYADADIYLQTPDIDNMPASILEAFASGCVVISTNAGGIPAVLTHEVDGLLVECNDHQGAAAQIIRVLRDPSLGRRLTDRARKSCESYQWKAVRERWLSLYRRTVTPYGVPAPTTV